MEVLGPCLRLLFLMQNRKYQQHCDKIFMSQLQKKS